MAGNGPGLDRTRPGRVTSFMMIRLRRQNNVDEYTHAQEEFRFTLLAAEVHWKVLQSGSGSGTEGE